LNVSFTLGLVEDEIGSEMKKKTLSYFAHKLSLKTSATKGQLTCTTKAVEFINPMKFQI
jgi:hypothetical protein